MCVCVCVCARAPEYVCVSVRALLSLHTLMEYCILVFHELKNICLIYFLLTRQIDYTSCTPIK